jgi:hypothetical protein
VILDICRGDISEFRGYHSSGSEHYQRLAKALQDCRSSQLTSRCNLQRMKKVAQRPTILFRDLYVLELVISR